LSKIRVNKLRYRRISFEFSDEYRQKFVKTASSVCTKPPKVTGIVGRAAAIAPMDIRARSGPRRKGLIANPTEDVMGRSFARRALSTSLVVASAAALAGSAVAGSLGTPTAPGIKVTPHVTSIPAVGASAVYTAASYGTGGVGMRNRQAGMILVSGVTGKAKAAWLYWSFLLKPGTTAPPTLVMKLTRISPGGTPNTTNLTGILLTTASDPCWASAGEAIYRAAVPVNIAKANGTYQIGFSSVESGSNKGGDPWAGTVYPLGEGASLIIVGTGSQTVAVYDAFAQTFSGTLNYTLNLPVAATGGVFNYDSIGADGQTGTSRSDSSFTDTEKTTINGVQIAGPGSSINMDSDWNGGAARPIPQLWDNTGHNIVSAAPSGTTALNVSIASSGDCITPIANVVGY
jgi:hypothetical protein